MRINRIKIVLGCVSAAALAACAGTQQQTTTTNPEQDLGPSKASDPLGVLEAKTPTRAVSVEEREDFDKAMATWRDIKGKGGDLSSSDCDRAARAFKGAAEENKTLQEARYNYGAVLFECGERDKA